MPRCNRAVARLALFSALGLMGCGDRGPGRAITGTVTLDGRPLDEGRIEFRPIGPGASAGASIERGSYRIAADQGPIPGPYRVNISSAQVSDAAGPGGEADPGPGRGGPGASERIPARYNASSTLTAEVKADGPNVFEFPLDSSKVPANPPTPKGHAR